MIATRKKSPAAARGAFTFLILALALAVFPAHSAAGQSTSRLSTHEIASKSLERTVKYNVILPEGYASSGKPYPVLYLLHGLMGHYDNWAERTRILQYSAPYELIIVMPEGNDGWYTNAENTPADRYEDYIVKDLVAEIEGRFRTRTDRQGRIIAGLSMGGYGALKFGMKYPEKFALAGSFSGAVNAARFDLDTFGGAWKALTDSIKSVYGEMGSKTRAENDLFKIVDELDGEAVRKLPFIYLDCGTEDGLIKDNRDLAARLLEKKVPHEFRQLPGGHDWSFWDKQIIEFLRIGSSITDRPNTVTTVRSQ